MLFYCRYNAVEEFRGFVDVSDIYFNATFGMTVEVDEGAYLSVIVEVFDEDTIGRQQLGVFNFYIYAQGQFVSRQSANSYYDSLVVKIIPGFNDSMLNVIEPESPTPLNVTSGHITRIELVSFRNPGDLLSSGEVCDTKFLGLTYKCDPIFNVNYGTFRR